MGSAGCEDGKGNQNRRKEYVNKAMECMECALEEYRRVEDLKGMLDILQKKAIVTRWRGDAVLANDVASQYLEVKREYEKMRL